MDFRVTDHDKFHNLVLFTLKLGASCTIHPRTYQVHFTFEEWKKLSHDDREDIRDFARIPFNNVDVGTGTRNIHTQEAMFQLLSRSPQFCEWWHNYTDNKQKEQLTRFFAHYWNVESMMEKFSFPSAEIRELARMWRDQTLALRKLHKSRPEREEQIFNEE